MSRTPRPTADRDRHGRPDHVEQLHGGGAPIEAARRELPEHAERRTAAGPDLIDLALEIGRNLVHGSDSVENGQIEIANFFSDVHYLSHWYSPEGPENKTLVAEQLTDLFLSSLRRTDAAP